eukprot:271599-Chlamydomonas_euryale.AAC.2
MEAVASEGTHLSEGWRRWRLRALTNLNKGAKACTPLGLVPRLVSAALHRASVRLASSASGLVGWGVGKGVASSSSSPFCRYASRTDSTLSRAAKYGDEAAPWPREDLVPAQAREKCGRKEAS